jgi:hypothetical protein
MENKIYTMCFDEAQVNGIIAALDCALSLAYKGNKKRFNELFDAKVAVTSQKDKIDAQSAPYVDDGDHTH